MKNKLCFYNFASTMISNPSTFVHLPCKLLLRIGTEKNMICYEPQGDDFLFNFTKIEQWWNGTSALLCQVLTHSLTIQIHSTQLRRRVCSKQTLLYLRFQNRSGRHTRGSEIRSHFYMFHVTMTNYMGHIQLYTKYHWHFQNIFGKTVHNWDRTWHRQKLGRLIDYIDKLHILYVCMYKGWAMKSGPFTATVNNL
jgi:hypothetical protein